MAKKSSSSNISGTVSYNDGTPASGLTVKVLRSPAGRKPIKEGPTDDEGRFRFPDLSFDEGDKPYLRVYFAGGRNFIQRESISWDADHNSTIEIRLNVPPPGGAIAGAVEPEIPLIDREPDADGVQQPEVAPAAWSRRLSNIRMAFDPGEKLNKDFSTAFAETGGDLSKAMEALGDQLDDEQKHRVHVINTLSDLADDDEPVVERMIGEIGPSMNIFSFANQPDLKKKLETIVAETAADAEPDKISERTDHLYSRLFMTQPTAVLSGMLGDKASMPIAHRAAVKETLEKGGADFDIRKDPIHTLFDRLPEGLDEKDKEEVKTELKTLQRISAISSTPAAVPVLLKAGLHSAFAISEMPRAQFISQFEGELGRKTAQSIYKNAENSRLRGELVMISSMEAIKGTGIAAVDKSIDKNGKGNPNINWDLLFGDADICECGECNSVYSPAAYFVELLQYLRNNNLEKVDKFNNPKNKRDISGTPLEKLLKRRPDLGCLELTCKNAYTLLPYVDLVNEVLENYVVHQRPKAFNVEEDQTSGELLSQPFHTNYDAYCTLSKEVYPFTLPYHQPIDAARIYLDHLGTSRHELLDTFRSACRPNDPDEEQREKRKKLHEQKRERAVDAEYLGLTQHEYIILTREAFTSKAYLEFCEDKVYTNEEYLNYAGVAAEYEYYGYDSKDDMIQGLPLVKDEFLRRTGIQYTDLVELLATRCLNPHRPEGKAQAISQAIPFSYRYLQNRFKTDKNPSGKKQLLEYLLAERKRIQGIEDNQPIECIVGKSDPEKTIDRADLEWWVECYFEDIGKMIVLESGDDCQCPDGVFFYRQKGEADNLYLAPLREIIEGRDDVAVVLRNCKIVIVSRKNPDGKIIKEIGSLDPYTGRIIFKKSDGTELKLGDDNNIYFKKKDETVEGIIQSGYLYQKFEDERTRLWACGIFNKDNCNLDNIRLKHLNGKDLTEEEYGRIHRFIRLWRKLGWTIDEVDKALAAGLSELPADDAKSKKAKEACCDDVSDEMKEDCIGLDAPGRNSKKCPPRPVMECRITPALLRQLAALKKLQSQTGMEVAKLLTFWTDISTAGEKSLYKRLFLSHNLTRLDPDRVFNADNNGNYLLDNKEINDYRPVLMAALNLSAEDIDAITKAASLNGKLTLANVSVLYRYRLLSKQLGLRIPEFIDAMRVLGNPFASPAATLGFMETRDKMESAGFDYRKLNYIVRGEDDSPRPISPDRINKLRLVKGLFDGLNAIEAAHKDLSETDRPDSEQLRAKATLLFDAATVEDIVAIVEGATIYNADTAKNLAVVSEQLADAKKLQGAAPTDVLASLGRKIRYDAANGKLTAVGLLSDMEIAKLKEWSSQENWLKSVAILEKRQKRGFDKTLGAIIESEKAVPGADQDAIGRIESELRRSDIVVPIPDDPAEDANTRPLKTRKFFELYLPYLRRKLAQRLILDTLSGYARLDRDTTNVLISTVLKAGTRSLYDVFESIKSLAVSAGNAWTGYLIPPADADYSFFVEGKENKPVIEGLSIEFEREEEDLGSWQSKSISLKAGKLYLVTLTNIAPQDLQWKTATTKQAVVPAIHWLPDFAGNDIENALGTLHRTASLIAGVNLSADEVQYLYDHSPDFGDLNFSSPSLNHMLRLESYTRLRNSLPKTGTNLLEFFDWASNTSDSSELAAKISALTRWKQERVEKLISAKNYKLLDADHFRNEEQLLRLHKAIEVADKIGMDIDLLFKWARTTSKFSDTRSIAESIRNAIRARYRQEDWEQVAKPLHDKLRANQRNALVAWILQRPELIIWGVTDADGLFEYFLIDVQMEPCMETSRIKQAISSVQLFIQRCFLGLEEKKEKEEKSGIGPEKLDRNRWNWMQRYRVWEANRKVFLYPENWIEPNLRDDKSPFFKELESELLQKDINKHNVTDALKNYLYKVDEVANMEVVGLYVEKENYENRRVEKLHVFSRTRNAPYFFYYRYYDILEGNWYPWEKMQVDIPSYDIEDGQGQVTGNGCYLTPVVWNGRLMVFFPQFMKKTKANENSGKSFKGMLDNDSPESSKPVEFWEIKLGWSEYRNGKWTQKVVSKDSVYDLTDKLTENSSNKVDTESVRRIIGENNPIVENLINTLPSDAKSLKNDQEAQRFVKYLLNYLEDIKELPNISDKNINDHIFSANNKLFETINKLYFAINVKQFKSKNTLGWEHNGNKSLSQEVFDNLVIYRKEIETIMFKIDEHISSASPVRSSHLPKISNYKFIPVANLSNEIKIKIFYDSKILSEGFTFSGSNIFKIASDPKETNSIIVNKFHYYNNSIRSLQNLYMQNYEFIKTSANTSIYRSHNTVSNFYHTSSSVFIGRINNKHLDNFFTSNRFIDDEVEAFGKFDSDYDGGLSNNDLYHELKRPYALYNWELFFHTPAVIADALTKARQYEEARNWFHYIFNPLNSGDGPVKEYWKFLPFREMDSQRILDSIFNQLQPNMADAKISAWRNNPFQPHLIARDRPVAYMKWVVMKYIDNLIAWGDELFRQDTIESINEATQLYIMAGHILGPRPQFIPKRGKVQPQTYLSMLDKWDAFSNAMAELELVQPYSSQISEDSAAVNGETAFANIFGFASTLYFCIPNNPKLMGYWDTVADRLFKIRHCQNMQGVFRKLSLFEPPIDPGLLVRAAAQGLSISSVLNDLNTPMPNYRFYYLLQKALELCNELKSLGGAMLSAIEKRDNETIALMRASHESSMHNLVMEVKKQQLEEAIKSVETLQQNRKSPESRMKYYLQLTGEDLDKVPGFEDDFAEIENPVLGPIDVLGFQLNAFELAEEISSIAAFGFQTAATVSEGFAGAVAMFPDVTANAHPMGVGFSTHAIGGDKLNKGGVSAAKVLNFMASIAQFVGSQSLKMNGYKRAVEERKYQANAAGYEIKQIDKQILAQQIRIDIANLEIKNQQQQIDNSREVEDFLRNKFSDEELYTWMRDSLKTLYAQVYSLAYDLAKKAEKVYRFERGLSDSGFIKPGYWDAGREGLLAGEHLYVGLKQLEAAYHENRGYDYEITRHISLRQLNPNALLELRAHGKCEFELPEYLFDMDFPGHYRRRIKSLSLSIPCIAGPYTGINAVLRLQKHKYRHTALAAGYGADSDENFSTNLTPITSIALSTAQNDSGMFELNFKDERHLPFEGAGVISRWKLELPDIRQFDYETITDIVVHLRYTAVEGGAALKNEANKSVINVLANAAEAGREGGLFLLLDLKNEFPNEWHRARNQEADFKVVLGKERFPYFAQTFAISPVDDAHRFFNSKLEPVNSGSVTSPDKDKISVTIDEVDYSEPVFLVLGYTLD